MTSSSIHTQLPVTAFAALGLLSFQPMSGYDLKQMADKSISYFYWSPAKSQIYAELRRLRKEGFVTEQHVEQDARPDKKIYQITQAGQKALTEWIDSQEYEPAIFKSVSLLKIFFGQNGDSATLIRMLENQIEYEKRNLTELKTIESTCSDPSKVFTLLTARAGVMYGEVGIKWAEGAIEVLRNMDSDNDTDEVGE